MLLQSPAEQKHHIALHRQVFSRRAPRLIQNALRAHFKDDPFQILIPPAAHQKRPFVPLAVKHLPEKIGNAVVLHQQAVKGIPEGTPFDDDIHRNRAFIRSKDRLADLRRDDDEIPLLHPKPPVLSLLSQVKEKTFPQGIDDLDELQAVIKRRHIPVMQKDGNLHALLRKAVLLGQETPHEKGRLFLKRHILFRPAEPLREFLPVPYHLLKGLRADPVQALRLPLKIPQLHQIPFRIRTIHSAAPFPPGCFLPQTVLSARLFFRHVSAHMLSFSAASFMRRDFLAAISVLSENFCHFLSYPAGHKMSLFFLTVFL